MKKKSTSVYVCPLSHTAFSLEKGESTGSEEIFSGNLISKKGQSYVIQHGIPNFLPKDQIDKDESKIQEEYDAMADQFYDAALNWLFESFYESEDTIRGGMIDLLELKKDSRVLEVGCGTGRDSFRIAQRLGKEGTLFLQDISPKMVVKTKKVLGDTYEKLGLACELDYFVSSATHLPFPDGYFDSLFHFGGFNHFAQQKQALEEFSRVVKKGGKVVFGDESLPPWLEDTEFGKIVINNNSLFKFKAPLECIPQNSRQVVLRWILGSCFFLIDYKVGEGLPPINLDLPHQGRRGGTMRTRYFGQLEGVTLEAKKMAQDAAQKAGLSLHDWLDRLVRDGAKIKSDKK
ncbi:class I SAM-dependent methyltransferase [Candidatus Roizmanbacteria bacterium]|nr:class I SAM-dependent methyltransferase [Candidatus Roizmanbacteria bacterium]